MPATKCWMGKVWFVTCKMKYLLIGGAPKCGTTSLFNYLSDHPAVCASNRKETYFFAKEFDAQGVFAGKQTKKNFQSYFSHCNDNATWRMEATPYTLYSAQAAKQVNALLPEAALLFIFRDPLKRLVSDYRMHVRREAQFVTGVTFDEFVDKQFSQDSSKANNLEAGCYVDYLQQFYDTIEETKINILIYEDFFADIESNIAKLCQKLGIDNDYYRGYAFNRYNYTFSVKYGWLNRAYLRFEPIVANARSRVMGQPTVYRWFENGIRLGKQSLRRLNTLDANSKGGKMVVSDSAKASINEYYHPSTMKLAKALDRSLPWGSYRA